MRCIQTSLFNWMKKDIEYLTHSMSYQVGQEVLGHLKNNYKFSIVPNGKLIILGVPKFRQITA